MKRPEIIEAIRETLKRVAPNAQAILYGSEARGDARHDSDVDLLILVDSGKIKIKISVALSYFSKECQSIIHQYFFVS